LERDDKVIARLTPAKPRSPLTVGELNAFLRSFSSLGDDADGFARKGAYGRICISPANEGDQNVSITIEMTDQEISEIKHLTHLENDAEAITRAALEYLRLIRLRELKAASGKVEFDANWQAG
jgi:hypothetical protein